MFASFFNKVSDFAAHHQAIIAAIVTICVVLVTWGLENLVERYFLPHSPATRHAIAIVIAAAILWFIQHTVMHVV